MSGRMARIDELERYPIPGQEGLTWRPVRRHFDIHAFGVNAYTAEEAGQRVVEEHREEDGHEELYVVLTGRATFMLDGEEHSAPAGTLIHCPPGTLRGAVAAEPRTTVLGIGATPGEVFAPSGWEWVFAGVSLLDQGDEEGARRELQAGIEQNPDSWQGPFNLACIEARLGNTAAALDQLERAAELDREAVAKYAPGDEDFASVKDEPRFLALTGQADAGGGSQLA
ncbi:MAG TPA: cupin domain-containing protein [Gaiellaceae bacterium]|nr:cupin domain-containing protein [Gaiellaceae bacterium]